MEMRISKNLFTNLISENKLKQMKNISIVILLFFVVAGINAQQSLSLEQAIARALENNYYIKITKSKEQIAHIRNNWGNAGRYPYLNLSAGADNTYNLNDDDNYLRNRLYAGASVTWTLFDGFAVSINKQRFEALEDMSKQNTAIMVEGTVQSVILAYFDALLQKEKLNVYQEVMTLSEDRFEQMKYKKELGAAVTYDLLQAQNAYLSDRSLYLLQEVNYKNALRDLKFLLADKSDESYALTEVFEALPKEYSYGELQTQMVDNNKQLQNQYVNLRLLQNAVASAKSAYMPSLDFRGGATHNIIKTEYDVKPKTDISNTDIYGNFTLSFNLFSGGNRSRALKIAKIDEEIGNVEIDEMKHELNNSLANIFEFYQVRKELLNVANENLEAARLNLQISQEKYDTGAINSFNFRDVQNIYLSASQRKLEAIYNFIDTQTAMLRMVGVILQQ